MYCRLLERGTQASTSAVTASTSGANISYWSLLRGKSGLPTEVGRFVGTPEPPMRTVLYAPELLALKFERMGRRKQNTSVVDQLTFRLVPCLCMCTILIKTHVSMNTAGLDMKSFFP